MEAITIIIGKRKLAIDDQDHFDNWLENKLKVESIIDENGVEQDRFSRLVDGGTYTLGPPIQQQQRQQQQQPISDTSAQTAQLKENVMPRIYVRVSKLFEKNLDEVDSILAAIEEMQDSDDFRDFPSPFACVFDSSGTGKTQLAATTALLRSRDSITSYFYVGNGDAENIQSFYRPHLKLWLELKPLLIDLCYVINGEMKNEVPGAGLLFDYERKHPLIRSLHKVFLGFDSDNTIAELREKLRKQEKRHFVFLDEIPPATSNRNFAALALRNILRAIGLVPILMSTHSGSHNAIPSGADSRTGDHIPKLWCRVLTTLPRRVTPVFSYVGVTERPLIAYLAEKSSDQENLHQVVLELRQKLKATKIGAWTKTPVFQLCQLFRSTRDAQNRNLCSHKLVGEHFGHFEGGDDSWVTIERTAAKLNGKIRMPEAELEPLLFLALASWSTEGLGTNDFPLLDPSDHSPISVREAFMLCRDEFTSSAFIDNPVAMKNDGNLMEVLALASMTLASLRTDNGIFGGVPMLEYIATVFCFLSNKASDLSLSERLAACVRQLHDFQKENGFQIPFASEIVPQCASADSEWPTTLFNRPGSLKRPADQEQRDGALFSAGGRVALIQVECKNYKDGIGTKVLQAVIDRMAPGVKVAFLFTSKLNGVWKEEKALDGFFGNHGLSKKDRMCLLYLTRETAPTWVRALTGEMLRPGQECQHLLVIFGVDEITTAD